MARVMIVMLLGMTLAAGVAAATERADEAQAPACKHAEINPVTGHVFCIDPLGAPVEAPPATAAAPCKLDQRTDADWTYGPTCTEPQGM